VGQHTIEEIAIDISQTVFHRAEFSDSSKAVRKIEHRRQTFANVAQILNDNDFYNRRLVRFHNFFVPNSSNINFSDLNKVYVLKKRLSSHLCVANRSTNVVAP